MNLSQLAIVGVISLSVLVLASSAGNAQQICGGVAGTPCAVGQFCELQDGECCCGFLGVCSELPGACPAVCEPVCGCDDRTYVNRCEAHRAGVSVAETGRCATAGTIELTGFDSTRQLVWAPHAEAAAYNVYVQDSSADPPLFVGRCLYTAVRETSVLLQADPASGSPWMVRVSGLFAGGEGPIGSGNCGATSPPSPCTCSLPADIGPCDATVPRWYHDYLTERCEPFEWGGCEGNANNFASQEACEAACLDVCDLPAVQGDCTAAFPRWYYNDLAGHCDTFTWGGCGGNANNFETLAECEQTCTAQP